MQRVAGGRWGYRTGDTMYRLQHGRGGAKLQQQQLQVHENQPAQGSQEDVWLVHSFVAGEGQQAYCHAGSAGFTCWDRPELDRPPETGHEASLSGFHFVQAWPKGSA